MKSRPNDPPVPPRLTRALLSLLVHGDDRALVLADLDERYGELLRTRGPRLARAWYRRQLVTSAPRLAAAGLLETVAPVLGIGWRELRLTARSLARARLFSLGFVGTLALGLASVSTVSTVAWHLWLAPLPYPDPDGVVRIYELSRPEEGGRDRTRLSPPLLEDLRRADLPSVQAVTGLSQAELEWSTGDDARRPVRLTALRASAEIFPILGLRSVLGRPFSTAGDEVVLTSVFWEARGADPAVVGSTLELGGGSYRVVGVVDFPEGYHDGTDVLVPLHFEESDLVEGMRGARYLEVLGRVAPGADVDQASGELDRFVDGLGTAHPLHEGGGAVAVPLRDDLAASFSGVLTILLAAGLAFLALAIVNVFGLVAARRIGTLPDMRVRRALGASRARLLGESVVEGGILGAVAGVLAVAATGAGVPTVVGLLPPDLPRIASVQHSAATALVTLAVGIACGGVVGLLGHGLAPRDGSAQLGPRASERLGTRRVLVGVQVALTTLLATVGMGVLVDAVALSSIDLGYDPERVSGAFVSPSEDRYPSPEARWAFWEQVLDGLGERGLDAAVTTNTPMSGSNMRFGFLPEGADREDWAQYHSVSDGYFALLGIDVVDGRTFDTRDTDGEPVVVVSRALAARHFPAGSAVGERLLVVGASRTVVGVVESTRHFGPGEDPPAELYVPLAQDPWSFGQVLLDATPAEATALAEVVETIDPALEPSAPQALDAYVHDWYAPVVSQLVIVGLLAAIGAVLAALGLYTTVAYYVRRRRREIGIRLALGAPAGRLAKEVVGQGLVTALGGLALGAVAWLWARGPAASWTGVQQIGDARVLATVAVGVMLVALAAVAGPAHRSTRVDPSLSLDAKG